jgi:hypothetical protein
MASLVHFSTVGRKESQACSATGPESVDDILWDIGRFPWLEALELEDPGRAPLGLQATCASPWGPCPPCLRWRPPVSSNSRHHEKFSPQTLAHNLTMAPRRLAGQAAARNERSCWFTQAVRDDKRAAIHECSEPQNEKRRVFPEKHLHDPSQNFPRWCFQLRSGCFVSLTVFVMLAINPEVRKGRPRSTNSTR